MAPKPYELEVGDIARYILRIEPEAGYSGLIINIPTRLLGIFFKEICEHVELPHKVYVL